MPRRSILSVAERENLLAVPSEEDELIRQYTLSETDLSIIRQHRGSANRLGFAIQLCYMRYPGIILGVGQEPFPPLLKLVAKQLKVPSASWKKYGRREQTRREHLLELQSSFGFQFFGLSHYRIGVQMLTELALQTDKGIVLVTALIKNLRSQKIILPSTIIIERICAEALTRADRRIYRVLTDSLTDAHRQRLDNLLKLMDDSKITWLAWLRQPSSRPNSRHMLEHIKRLKYWQALDLPAGIEKQIHQNRLLRIAREGGQMPPADLAKFIPQRRYATLVAQALEGIATVTDEIVDLHDRIIGKLFNTAKSKHQQEFQDAGKEINDKVRLYGSIGQALVTAKENGNDPFAAIESVIPWEVFVLSVSEAQKLAQPKEFDFLHYLSGSYSTLRRYAPELLDALKLHAAPVAQSILDAVNLLRVMNAKDIRKVPADAPTEFVRKRWKKLVVTSDGFDRRYYELCVLSELKNALRSGDIWVQGSRQFRDFEEYLLPKERFTERKQKNELQLAVTQDCEQYLRERLSLLEEQLEVVNRLAANNELPDAIVTQSELKITPLETGVPDSAKAFIGQTAALLPHIKITELLLEVDEWTDFTRHFTHLKTNEPVKDKIGLLTTILADAINLGLTKMAESSPGTSYAKLSWLQAWHVRDDTYSQALAELVNAQCRHPFAEHWGDGTTSSSDGQRFRASGKAESTGHINPKYGSEPGRMFYTHISDQYAPFSTKVVNVGIRDSTYVLDGLLYHESDLRIEEHYTDTAGFTDHVFALMHFLGFRFAPRIRDLKDTKLYVPKNGQDYSALQAMIGGHLNIQHIRKHWDEILRLAASIKEGTVTASLMMRKLSVTRNPS
jgi:TnpA family transposase